MSFLAGVVCDGCGRHILYDHIGKTHIARWTREEGWSHTRKNGNDISYCPTCRKLFKEEKRRKKNEQICQSQI